MSPEFNKVAGKFIKEHANTIGLTLTAIVVFGGASSPVWMNKRHGWPWLKEHIDGYLLKDGPRYTLEGAGAHGGVGKLDRPPYVSVGLQIRGRFLGWESFNCPPPGQELSPQEIIRQQLNEKINTPTTNRDPSSWVVALRRVSVSRIVEVCQYGE